MESVHGRLDDVTRTSVPSLSNACSDSSFWWLAHSQGNYRT